MCVLALVIPNFSRRPSEANFSTPVNVVLSLVALGVYAIFLTGQMVLYRSTYKERESLVVTVDEDSETLGQLIETGITDLGLPSSLAGVLVAMLIWRQRP